MALKKIVISLGSTHMTEQRRMRVMRETEILKSIKHQHIVKMHAHFIDSEIS
jgi:serine/threonine protein kinase